MDHTIKFCVKCKKYLPVTDFLRRPPFGGTGPECIACTSKSVAHNTQRRKQSARHAKKYRTGKLPPFMFD